ncbi:MAG TPA: GspMb/PilO family protein [Vicinamibacterales bacterium]|nr:GspMb/PilO family protein [Vicinamibacterales bacterium]
MIAFERIFREKRSLMLPLLIALAINVGLLVLAVLPLTQSVASEETRAVAAAAERARAEQTFARAEAIVNGKVRADRELARFYGQVLPPNQSGARSIAYLNLQQLARAAGLSFTGQSTTVREPREAAGLTKYATELTLAGPYRGIRQFIHAVESQPAFLVIESLELATAPGQNEPLQVTVRLATYYRSGDGS